MANLISLMVRLPADVHEALKAAAKRESRSLNGQVVYLLRQALGL